MADVVRNGAIFRVKNATSMRSPMPRLPVARGRIASATPETPAAKRRGAGNASGRSALERVVPRAPMAPPPLPQQQKQKQTRSVRAKKHGVTPRKGQHAAASATEASVRASFNRLVRENETRHATQQSPRSSAMMETEEEDEEEEEEEEGSASSSEAADDTAVRRPKGHKRPRREPEVERSEDEEERASNEEEMVTPPPRRRSRASSEDDSANDNDGVQVQKRLMYDDTPPAKTKPLVTSAGPPAKTKAPLPPKPKPTRKASTSAKRVTVAGGSGLEMLSLSSAATPSRSTRIRTGVLVMSEWYLEWPPAFEGDQLQLRLQGQVLGQPSSFAVQRRVTDLQFVSTDNQNVRLSGCLDIDRAQRADVPPVVMELLVEGIPTNWRQLLDAYAPPPDPWVPLSVKSKEKAKQKRAQAAAAAAAVEAEQKKSVPIPGVTKPALKKAVKSTTPATMSSSAGGSSVLSSAEKRSRSGRRLTPVMEWWRNERKIVDANFEATIVEGSPSYLPSTRTTAMSDAAKAARQKIQEIYDAQRKSAEWSDAQLQALHDAKVQVPTTHVSFWAEVAKLVPGKSADECRARSFDDLPTAPARKGTGSGGTRAGVASANAKQSSAASQVPVKIHRAGSNLFKKQVRHFVHDQEQKNVDDLFSQSTPSKDAIADASGLDDLKSPGAPMVESHDRDGDDSDDDALLGGAGRELLEKVSLSKRDDVDSYVRTLKRGNDGLGLKAVRTSQAPTSAFMTPQAKKKPRREGVHMVSEVGAHVIEAIVTPGGTTRVRVEMGSDDDDMLNDDEEDEEAQLSDAF